MHPFNLLFRLIARINLGVKWSSRFLQILQAPHQHPNCRLTPHFMHSLPISSSSSVICIAIVLEEQDLNH